MYKNLYEMAMDASRNAYCPYSNFRVGAAVLLDNGEIVCGSNQENASFSLTMCAERVAIFSANSRYPQAKVVAIAVASTSTENTVTPCGACRQVMCEVISRQGSDFDVVISGKTVRASELMPLAFKL